MGYNTGYGSYKTDPYKGSLVLFNNYPNNLENMGIFHYTNNSVGNEYGEFMTKTKFSFPTLMYHRSNVIGHTFSASTEDKYFTNEIELNIPTIDTPNLQITGYTNVGVTKMFSGYTFYVSAYTDRGETLATKKFYYKKDGYLFDKTTYGVGYNTGSENTSIYLSWSGITNATGYNLYTRKNFSFSGVTTGNYGDGRGNVSIFPSYQFTSTTWTLVQYHFRSLDTWLDGVCKSHCDEHPWNNDALSYVEAAGKRSIFCDAESNEEDEVEVEVEEE
jgi:hypothetical protein